MKRYLLFAFFDCYPLGGMDDFVDSFNTIEDCVNKMQEIEPYRYNIFDTKENKIVVETREKISDNFK